MLINLSIIDYLIIILYFLIVLYIGFRTKILKNSGVDYFVAGRNITLPAFVATLVSSFYGGILGIGEFTYRYGISSWFLNAVPYYIFITFFAFFLSKKVRKTNLYTIPDKLTLSYGKSAGIIGGILIFILSSPAPYIFMMGIIVSMIFNISVNLAMLFSLIISIVYLVKGGLRADIRVNVFEFLIMFLGFGIIIPFCFLKIGDFNFLQNNLPAAYLSLSGGNSFQFILAWYFIGAWALVDPNFHQRCYAAKSESTAKNGVLISIFFWFIFDLMTTTAGLYSFVHIKNIENPAMSYPLLAESILPSAAKGLFFAGMIATVMSTLHSNFFIASLSISRDVIGKILNNKNELEYIKLSILLTAIISIIIPLFLPSVVQMWYTIGSLTIPALLLSLIPTYFKKFRIENKFAIMIMLSSSLINLFWMISGLISNNTYPLGIEPFYPGLSIGLIIYIFALLMKKRKFEKINI